MDAKELGITTPVEEDEQKPDSTPETTPQGEDKGSQDQGQNQGQDNSEETQEGQSNDVQATEGGDDSKDEEGAGKATDKTPSSDKRYDDLMSKWQKEESAHQKTKDSVGELVELLKTRLGDSKPEQQPEFMKPGWKPESYDDIQKAILDAQKITRDEILSEQRGKEQETQTAKEQVDKFISFVKNEDKEFDEQAFYEYANKHKFSTNSAQDLMGIYSSFVEMREAIKGVRKETKENIKNRQDDKVGQSGGSSQGTPVMTDQEISKSGSCVEAALEAYRRITGK